jgi:hypothetical protein
MSVSPTGNHDGKVTVIVVIGVSKVTSTENHCVIEQRATGQLGDFQLMDQSDDLCEDCRFDFHEFVDFDRVLSMVGKTVMQLENSIHFYHAMIHLNTHVDYSGGIGLENERNEVKHQCNAFLVLSFVTDIIRNRSS